MEFLKCINFKQAKIWAKFWTFTAPTTLVFKRADSTFFVSFHKKESVILVGNGEFIYTEDVLKKSKSRFYSFRLELWKFEAVLHFGIFLVFYKRWAILIAYPVRIFPMKPTAFWSKIEEEMMGVYV